MKVNNSRLSSVLLISFLLIFNECGIATVTGLVIDGTSPDKEIVNREDYNKIKRSKIITVHLKDNSSKVGRIKEIDEEYLIFRTGRNMRNIEKINLDEILSVEITARKNRMLLYGLGIDLALYIAFVAWYGDGT